MSGPSRRNWNGALRCCGVRADVQRDTISTSSAVSTTSLPTPAINASNSSPSARCTCSISKMSFSPTATASAPPAGRRSRSASASSSDNASRTACTFCRLSLVAFSRRSRSARSAPSALSILVRSDRSTSRTTRSAAPVPQAHKGFPSASFVSGAVDPSGPGTHGCLVPRMSSICSSDSAVAASSTVDWSCVAIVTASQTPPAARPREYAGCSNTAACRSRSRSEGCSMQRSKSRCESDQDASASISNRSSCSTSDRKSTSRGNCTADSAATRQLGSVASTSRVAADPMPADGTTYST